jgi:predicted subunit of tRNA(5-methylaminomethyl-2-thiouridylate) methyltransferase
MNELKNDSITPEDYETELRQLLEPKEFQLRVSNFSWAEFLRKSTITCSISCRECTHI